MTKYRPFTITINFTMNNITDLTDWQQTIYSKYTKRQWVAVMCNIVRYSRHHAREEEIGGPFEKIHRKRLRVIFISLENYTIEDVSRSATFLILMRKGPQGKINIFINTLMIQVFVASVDVISRYYPPSFMEFIYGTQLLFTIVFTCPPNTVYVK